MPQSNQNKAPISHLKACWLLQSKPLPICCLHSEGPAQELGHKDTGQSLLLNGGRGWGGAEGGSAELCEHSPTMLKGSGPVNGQKALENH